MFAFLKLTYMSGLEKGGEGGEVLLLPEVFQPPFLWVTFTPTGNLGLGDTCL